MFNVSLARNNVKQTNGGQAVSVKTFQVAFRISFLLGPLLH